MYKKIITLLLFILISIFHTQPIYGKQTEEVVITIGYCVGYGTISPFEIKGSEGLGYEYFDEIKKYSSTPIAYEYVAVNWEDAFDLLDNGTIDVFGPVNITEARAEKYLYPDMPFGTEEMIIAALASDEIELNDFKVMNDSVIGILSGSATATSLYNYLNKYSITANTIDIPTIDISWMQRNAYYNLIWISSLQDTQNLQTVAHVSQEPFYYITAKDEQAIMDIINNGLENIQKNTPLFFEFLYHKYYGNLVEAKPSISVLDQIALNSKEVYSIGFSSDHRPFSYMNANGEPVGIAIDVMNELAADGGFSVEYIALDNSENLSPDEFDILVSVFDNHVNASGFHRVSDSYLTLPLTITGSLEHAAFAHCRIGYLNYYDLTPEIMDTLFPNSISVEFYTSTEIITALETQEIDYMVSTSILAEELLISTNNHYTTSPVNYDLSIPLFYSDNLREPQVAAFDTLLQRLDSNATHNLLLSNMLISHSDKTLFETLYKYRVYTLLGLAILFFLLIIMFIASKKQAMIKMVNHDNLTGLFSEYAFIQKSTKCLKKYPEEDYSILALDIDHFKHLKEMYGYEASQIVIQLVSTQLKNCFSDARVISRVSQDLFMILVPSYAIKNRCDNKLFCLNYIQEELEQILGVNFPLHTSVGIYHIEDKKLRLSYMMDCANYARLSGKGNYGKTAITYTPDMAATRYVKSNVVSNMEEGLARKEFVMCYQPKVDLQTQEIIGAEALVRWKRTSTPPIYPDQFISVFERNGFIVKLDYYVFEEVCIFIHNNKFSNLPRISINVSGLTLLEEDFLPKIATILETYSVPVDSIEIEITESAIIERFDIVIQKLNAIRDYGISVSMDDFGSGVSSLHRLKDISIDVIKLDRDFLGDTLDAHKGATIIENIIHMSKQLKLKIVAEGVENEEQRKLLADMGCDYGQGYLFSKPIFENEFLELI